MSDLPYTLIAELTHRCPLHCAYCSNPAGERAPAELAPDVWRRVLEQARALGVVQVHFTGGEPLFYAGLEELVARAGELGLCAQLVTSGVGLSEQKLRKLAPGLTSIQVSLHAIGGNPWPPAHALRAARWARDAGIPLTLNLVLHRQNLARTREAIELAEALGAERLELANVQYLGWAALNREGLLPSETQLAEARQVAQQARERLRGRIDVVFVLADHHSGRPRACMQGWGRRFVVVAPDGSAKPCHAADVLGVAFDNVAARSLSAIWHESAAFRLFRGDSWMLEPCRSCDRKHIDYGGCRCQAKLVTGDARAADPACRLSPEHWRVRELVRAPRLIQLRSRQLD